MDPVQVSGTPAPAAAAPAAAPAAPVTMAQQIVDSQVKPAAPATPAVAPVVQQVGDAAPGGAPQGDSALKDKLAEAEKRLQDTQKWGHKNAEEAAKLKNALTQIQNHPVVGRLLEAMAQGQLQPTGNAQADAEQAEMQRAWADYQASKSDEEAFAKILTFAETRAARRALAETQRVMVEKENTTRIQQRNQLTVQAINKTVSDSAPDVPLELFWAMSGRAESETPAELTDYTSRLQWQVGRAIDLSRAVLTPRVAQAVQAGQQQAAVNQQGGVIMAGGGAAPGAQVPGTPAKPQTMAEYIQNMQRAQMEKRAV